MKKLILFFAALTICSYGWSQSRVRRLPTNINHPSLNLFAPYISFDGNALLFISDYGQDGAYIVSYTTRNPDWATPIELPKHISNKSTFLPGYALSADGQRIYFTSAKSPTVGGYDILVSDLKGSTWGMPENLAIPINSKLHEGCPSVTPDAKTIYFMRCNKMDANKADGCKIFRASKKTNGQWEEPVELPDFINTGNSQTPRIMADGETLLFSSDKMGGKGGMDLFVTRFSNGAWSSPVPLDFVNTERDDQYVSATALGRYLLKENKGQRNKYELTEFLLPDNLRPKGITKYEGRITGEDGSPIAAYISVTDVETKKRIYSAQPSSNGDYAFYLKEGSLYGFSVDPEKSDYWYFTTPVDLREGDIEQKQKVDILLTKPSPGQEFQLNFVSFKPRSSSLNIGADEELKRLGRLAKANPDLRFEVKVTLHGFRSDSYQSDPDLSETKVTEVPAPIDSTGSVLTNPTMLTTYHNDRSEKQIETIKAFLLSQEVEADQLSFVSETLPGDEVPSRATVSVKVL